MRHRRAVAVVGPGGDVPAELLSAAEDVSRELARQGVVVVTGGLGGIMAAAARGAAAAGGDVVGFLPGLDVADADPNLTIVVPTGLGEARNALVVRASLALVAVGGSWGTLSEVAIACRTGRPVVTLGGWSVRTGDGAEPPGGPVAAGDPADAVATVLRLIE